MHIHQTDVVVAGAGPVGLCTALFLHEHGLDVTVAEEKPSGVTHSYALALHPASLQLLEMIGLAEPLLARARKVRQLAIHAGDRRIAEIPVAAAGAIHPCIAIVGQDVFESVLGDELKRRSVPLWWNHRLARFDQDATMVNLQLDELEERTIGYAVARFDRLVGRTHFIGAHHLVGADGHASLVRRQLGIDFNEVRAPEHFAVFEFQTDGVLADEISLVLHDDGLAVLWPLPDGRARWSFAVDVTKFPVALREKDHEPVQFVAPGVFPALAESSFALLLKERAPWFQHVIKHTYWRMMVRFERRLVPNFGTGRVWLAGDAAHLTGPVGIQSMNVGLGEARALADAIAGSNKSGSSELLEAYNRASLARWRRLHGLEGRVVAGADAAPEIASRKDQLIACLPASGEALVAMAARLGLHVERW